MKSQEMEYSIEAMFGIAGSVAVVSGAAGGIGREICVALSSLGAKIALVDLDAEKLSNLESVIRQDSGDVLVVRTDITDKDRVGAMAEAVIRRFERIDILVNCAGLSYLEDAVDFDEQKWDRLMEVNVKGTFLVCQAVGRHMLKQRSGRIVNFSSVRGLQGRARDLAYAPSKGAINQLTKSLAIEWAQSGINVNALAPTWILTEMNRSMLEDKNTSQWVLSRIPKGRLGEPKDLVGPLIYLCAPCSEFVTGQVLYIDGGWTAA